jgi:predicted secreted protein
MIRSVFARVGAVASLLAATSISAIPIWAAEYSTGNSLGFSRDGNHFVFEEYGVTDGLGAPYVQLFAIDIVSDRWLKGTPVRLTSSEEEIFAFEDKMSKNGITDRLDIQDARQVDVDGLRARARNQAQPVLKGLGKLRSGDLRVYNPPQELTGNAKTVRFSNLYYRSLINSDANIRAWRLDLAEKKFPASEACFGRHDKMAGFSLLLTNETSGEATVLNQDTRVPKSRNCPQKYYIEQVLTYPRKDGGFSLAVLVRYATPGFEGPDGRLIAVTRVIDP